MNELINTWHARLTEARQVRGVGKSDFARAVGVKPSSVTDWENGDTKMIDGANLVKVCDFLQVRPSWLIEGKGLRDATDEAAQESMMYAWVSQWEMNLLSALRCTDDEGRKSVMVLAESMPKLLHLTLASTDESQG